jgi:hypothetical protein
MASELEIWSTEPSGIMTLVLCMRTSTFVRPFLVMTRRIRKSH